MGLDHFFALVWFVLAPLEGAGSLRRLEARIRAQGSSARRRRYLVIIGQLLASAAAAIGLWVANGRVGDQLGLRWGAGLRLVLGVVVAVVIVGALMAQARAVHSSTELQERVRKSVGNLAVFLPHERADFALFCALAVTAGIAEELVYRGYLMWYVTPVVGSVGAVVLSSVAFGFAHLYQGVGGMLRTTVVGGAMAGLYVLSGAIWVPMVVHALVDLIQGWMLYQALRHRPNCRSGSVSLQPREAG